MQCDVLEIYLGIMLDVNSKCYFQHHRLPCSIILCCLLNLYMALIAKIDCIFKAKFSIKYAEGNYQRNNRFCYVTK